MKEVKQILLITDGHSNRGGDPVKAAREACRHGVTVNVIGITDSGHLGEQGALEVEAIANAGEGFFDLVQCNEVGYTMQMLTCKATRKALETVVNNELQKIIGKTVKEISPDKRSGLIKVLDKVSDEVCLECCFLLDMSGSMNNKIEQLKSSVTDMLEYLRSRPGDSRVAVITFPGSNQYAEVISPMTDVSQEYILSLDNLHTGGITPTAPAIYRALKLFNAEYEQDNKTEPVLAGNMI